MLAVIEDVLRGVYAVFGGGHQTAAG
jgi:hypothetical protein